MLATRKISKRGSRRSQYLPRGKFFLAENESFSEGTSTLVTVFKNRGMIPLCHQSTNDFMAPTLIISTDAQCFRQELPEEIRTSWWLRQAKASRRQRNSRHGITAARSHFTTTKARETQPPEIINLQGTSDVAKQNPAGNLRTADTIFPVSARCIFVHKNNLAAPPARGRGYASELGIPDTPIFMNPIQNIPMPRKKARDQASLLIYPIRTRVSEKVYQRLTNIVNTSDCQSVGELARRILSEERIRMFHQDSSLDNVMHELTLIQKELNAIGTNINQVVHHFHLAQGAEQKMIQAFKVAEQYNKVGDKVSILTDMVSALTKKWLQR